VPDDDSPISGFTDVEMQMLATSNPTIRRSTMNLISKLGAVGGVCAVAVLASTMPAFAATNSDAQQVTGTVVSAMAVTVIGGPVAFTGVNPNANPTTVSAGSVQVASNTPYDLEVSDSGGLKIPGNGTFLQDSLQIGESALSGAGTVAQPTTGDPVAIDSTPGTTNAIPPTIASDDTAGIDVYAISLTQKAEFVDPVSSGYSDTLTYTATPQV
jgi:hypothetical protein